MKRLLLLTAFLIPIVTNAGSKSGADISMKYISSGKYEITAHMYRDCRGIPISTISFLVKGNGVSANIPSTRTSTKEVNIWGPNVTPKCNPQNTTGTGKGLEEHTFVGIIDFNSSPFNTTTWINSCEITVGFGQCCRNAAITTGQVNTNFYMEMMFDKCLAAVNSTPEITGIPLFEVANSQPVYYNYGIKEADGDSFSVAFSTPKTSSTAYASYSSSNLCNKQFSPTMPLTPLLSFPCAPLVASPNSNPPLGIYLGDETGELIYTPNESNEVGIICIEITEWRKIAGVPKVISKVYHEMTVMTASPTNNVPIVTTSVNQKVYAGQQNCFTINFKDDPYGTAPADTLEVDWGDTIAGATFTVDTNSRLRPATFCWTPTCDDVRQKPYRFTVNVKDGASPQEGRTTRVFNITVAEKPPLNLGADKNVCEGTGITIQADSNYKEYLWSTNDTTHSIQTSTEGVYWLKVIAACNNVVSYDTIEVIHHNLPAVNLPADTLICDDTTFKVGVSAPNALSVNWTTNELTDSIIVDKPGYYAVAVNDAYCGTFRDTIHVDFLKSPFVDLGEDRPYCRKVNRTLSAEGNSLATYLWSTGQTTKSIYVTEPQKYWVKITNACGIATDTVDYSDLTAPLNVFLGEDTLVCDKDELELTSNITGNEYWWSTNEITKSITITQSGEYILRVDKCLQYAFDTINVSFNKTPVANLGADIQLDSPFSIQLDAGVIADNYLWSTNEDTKSITVTKGGAYWVAAGNECGAGRDTINVIVNSIGQNKAIAKSIKVYPNPTDGSKVTVEFEEAVHQNVTLSLIALTGEEVYSEKLAVNGNSEHTLSFNNLATGIYFLQIKSPKGIATVKLVVK